VPIPTPVRGGFDLEYLRNLPCQDNQLSQVTKLVGTTEPATADIGTIRGDFSIDTYSHTTFEDRSIRNLIHCSDVPAEAEREIALWFKADEVLSYTTAQERILYNAHFDDPTV
jgi:nucleoside-diphosphate kinase